MCGLKCRNRDLVTNSLPHFMLFLAIIIIVYRSFLFYLLRSFFTVLNTNISKISNGYMYPLKTLQSLLKVRKSEEREGQSVIQGFLASFICQNWTCQRFDEPVRFSCEETLLNTGLAINQGSYPDVGNLLAKLLPYARHNNPLLIWNRS